MSEMDKTKYRIETPVPGLTLIDDYSDATCYLIEGQDAALLIDTAMGGGDFPAMVRGMTEKPIKLAITHVHGDHYMYAASFSPVYLHPADIEVLPAMNEMFSGMVAGRELLPENTTPVADGDLIDLGGDVIEVVEMQGHTPGSIGFLWKNRSILFVGDAIGSGVGVWMQCPFGLSTPAYKKNLQTLLKRLEPIDGLVMYGGHVGQAGEPGTPQYNPPSLEMLRDLIALCDEIIAGEAAKDPYERSFTEEPAYIATHGKAGMVYLESRSV